MLQNTLCAPGDVSTRGEDVDARRLFASMRLSARASICLRWFRSHGRRSLWYRSWRRLEFMLTVAEATFLLDDRRHLLANLWNAWWCGRGQAVQLNGWTR